MLTKPFHIDVHAPRYRPVITDILAVVYKKDGSMQRTDHGFYKKLKEQYPNLLKYTNRQIADCIKGFNLHLRDTALVYKDGIQLPAQMGRIIVCTMGKRTIGIDRKRSNEVGYRVYYRNDTTEGYGVGLYYTGYHMKEYKSQPIRMFANCEFWAMYPSNEFKTLMSKAYKKDWKHFWMIPKSRHISDMTDSYQKQLKTKKIVKQIKDKYSEFDFKRKKK